MVIVNVEDARSLARRRLPRIFFDYIDGGAFAGKTLRANEADFDDISLRQTVLTGVSAPSTIGPNSDGRSWRRPPTCRGASIRR